VNVFDDMKRYAFTYSAYYLTIDKVNIGHELRYIDVQKKRLEEGNDLSDKEKAFIQGKIEKSERE